VPTPLSCTGVLQSCTRSSQKCISNSCTVLDSLLEEERDKVKNLDLDYIATFGKSIRCAVVCWVWCLQGDHQG